MWIARRFVIAVAQRSNLITSIAECHKIASSCLPMTCSNTLSIKPIKIQNSGHNFELEQRSSFTAFRMTGLEAARLEKCTGRTVIPIAALQQLRELSTIG